MALCFGRDHDRDLDDDIYDVKMQYLYHKEAGLSRLQLFGDEHRYIFKVRRHKIGESIYLRNLHDEILYEYHIEQLDKKMAYLQMLSGRELSISAKRPLHIAWCKIDPKSVEKALAALNEIGVSKITFIDCQRSQKSFRIDFVRLQKILVNSSQQCGRSILMELAEEESMEKFLQKHPESRMLNFSKNLLTKESSIETLLIGPEGGFDREESELMEAERVVGFDTELILKSESAICSAAAKLLL
ncbi:MAG: 16S rRNA (uracil(1498)-N(3))-methyltransferase [Campylobacterota bacterium]|nr:16S rRNA (uracil(1498)-N(3))-methyltransferase [Campylobacterota bacterium]